MVSIYTHESGLDHDTGPGHPECPARLQVLYDLFAERGLNPVSAPAAEWQWVARVHDEHYMDTLQMAVPESGYAYVDGDTVLSPQSWEAAMGAAGAVCAAVADIIAGRDGRAFCAVRPPGHHAEPARAMGFCLFNNVFVGALHAQALGAGRIAIVDFDVHHGNGSDAMARLHDDIFYISSHQYPLFPGTGRADERIPDRLLNLPLPAGTDGGSFRAVYDRDVFPALESFAPDMILLSAGFDAHRDDPLAQMNLDADDFRWVTQKLCRIAHRHCGGRVVSVLEGGYALPALKEGVAAHIDALDA